MRSKFAAAALLAIVVVSARPCAAEPAKIDRSLDFTDERSAAAFRAYKTTLASDPSRYDAELATVSRLERSDVRYVIRVAPTAEPGVEGDVSTDGERVFVTVSDGGGPYGETASLASRLAHELEHARQFDAGELAFVRDPRDGRWKPQLSSYDIGDEVKAWAAQLRVASASDFWLVTHRKREPSVLKLFSLAADDDARAGVLRGHGYADRYPVRGCDVAFPRATGFAAGELVRPTERLAFFGRVRRVV